MAKLVNRAKMTTATTGTGDITLGSAVDGYQSFAGAGVVDGDSVRYVIEDGSNWEIGTGTYTASGTTLTRTVLESSNADAAINLSGTAQVFISAAAEDIPSVTKGTLTKSFFSGETSTISLSQAITAGVPVVSVTKEVPQIGVSSKGAWDVATTGVNYDRHNTAYATTLTPSAPSTWNISTAVYSQNFSVSAQETSPQGIFFKPDGLKMYVIGNTGDAVHEYNLSTAWDISTAVYSQNFSVAAQDTFPTGIFFKPDGLKMYVVGASGDDVNEYNLSSAWDISTAVYSQNFSVAAQETIPFDLFFKPDGLKMYVVGAAGQDVNEYNLSSAWDISTAVYSQNFSVSAQETSPSGLFFKPDGTKMYVVGFTGDDVNEYNLSTAWNISTAVYSQNFSVAGQETSPQGIFFKPDGLKMYVIGNAGDAVNEYSLGSQGTFTLGAGSFTSSDVGKQIEGNGGKAILTATDGSYFLITTFNDTSTIASGGWGMFGLTFDTVSGFRSTLSTEFSASYSQNFSVSAQETSPSGLFFKPDGLKMYILGLAGQDVNEYNLSTAWDVSTAVYSQNFSVAAQETNPFGIFFKPDGLKMYIVGLAGQDVNEYNLSIAWDISTASYSQNFSVAGQDTSPQGIFFKPDGLKMYVVGASGDDVNEYNLSSAWDISTAVYNQNFSVSAQETSPSGLFFKPDGTKMYVVGATGDAVNEYNLSTAWDISTASYSQNFSVAAQETFPEGISFKPDGLKMYVIGNAGDAVNEYNLLDPWNIGLIYYQTINGYSPAITNTGGQIDSTYWTDINSMTTDQVTGDGEVYYAVSTDGRTTWKVIDNTNGERPIVRNNGGTWEYNSNATYTSTTWTASTTNEELYAIQQALSSVASNRMNKTQLEAVTDPNHYVLGNSLDLMIALNMPTASANVPSSDGVSINYDAAVLNKGAVLGTDYDFDFPANDVVRITSNATNNLKVRIV